MIDIFGGKIDLSALFDALDSKNHSGPLASPPPAQTKNEDLIGLFATTFNPLFDTFKQNPSQDDNQSRQRPSDLIEIDPPLKAYTPTDLKTSKHPRNSALPVRESGR
jgi:hypothetical protein